VLDYRVHVISQGRSTKQIFPVTDTASLNISDLSDDADYFLTIDARTQAGYNDSLHLKTIYIPKSADGLSLGLSYFVTLLCLYHRKSLLAGIFCFFVCPSVSESVHPKNLVNTISIKL